MYGDFTVSNSNRFPSQEVSLTRSRNLTIGLIISAVLAVVDIISVSGVGADNGPPIPVLVIGVVLGIITLVGVSLAWRGKRGGVPTVVVSRVLSALSGIPVFFVGEEEEVPGWVAPSVAVAIVLTIVALALIYAGRRSTD